MDEEICAAALVQELEDLKRYPIFFCSAWSAFSLFIKNFQPEVTEATKKSPRP
jgi:hypothetical protein